jgi:hypothetical protein
MHDIDVIDDLIRFIEVTKNAKKKELLDITLEEIIKNNYICNSSI